MPVKPIDPEMVYKLAQIHCSIDEICVLLEADRTTLYDNFSHELQKGHIEGKMSIKRKMFEIALKGNTTMLIWLGKQYLGHKDQIHPESMAARFDIVINEMPT